MAFSQFGAEQERLVVYFHDAPGSPQECAVFDTHGKTHGLTFVCFGRFGVDLALDAETYAAVPDIATSLAVTDVASKH
ncbi:MAG: hypothetical protein RI964_505 [Pseudomonadota bacterium]